MNRKIGRRTLLRGAGFAAMSAVVGQRHAIQGQISTPHSTGAQPPKLKAPALACDCHLHIYDTERFLPAEPGAVPNARVEEYRVLQRRIGTARAVIVTPRPYGTDNRVTLDAIAQLGGNARGVAVVHPAITEAELKRLDAGGIRGIRFSIGGTSTTPAVTTVDMIEPLSKRVSALGWHVQIAMRGDQIVALADLWSRLPSVIVFDHMGQLPLPDGVKHPAYMTIRKLIDRGRTWVKLSVGTSAASYAATKDATRMYEDVNKVGHAYAQAAPERMGVLFDLLTQWTSSEADRHRILVENPGTLYGFAGR